MMLKTVSVHAPDAIAHFKHERIKVMVKYFMVAVIIQNANIPLKKLIM